MSVCLPLFAIGSFAASQHVALLADRVLPPHFCIGQPSLDVASEFFVELANKEDGIVEYNALVGYYHRQEWDRLEQGIQSFLATFETTPLREPVAYLQVQSMWDRLTTDSSESAVIEAEKRMREVLLLYPKSSLAPVLTNTFGAFSLRKGHPEKSLSVYSEARQRYPFSELSCVFQMGMGESHFQLKHSEQATKSFQQILQKCQNPRLRVGAQARIAELLIPTDPTKANNILKFLMEKNGQFVYQFYPETLYNIGELRFKLGDLNGAKHYFTEVAGKTASIRDCAEMAQLRLADLSLKQKAPLPESVGRYLEMHEKAPRSNIGRFAYIRALLLELDTVNPVERARRIKVTDEEIHEITDREVQKEAFLEKGIALLQLGEELALPYLARYSEVADESLRKNNVGNYIRDRVGKQLAGLTKRFARTLPVEEISDRLKPFEVAFTSWMKGEKEGRKAQADVKRFIVDQIERTPSDASRMIQVLDRYAASPFFQKGIWTTADASKLQGRLIAVLVDGSDDSVKRETAQNYRDKWKELNRWLPKNTQSIEMILAHQLSDQETLMRTVRKGRGLASIRDSSIVLGPKWTPQYQLSVAQALLAADQLMDAEKVLAQVTTKGAKADFVDRYDGARVELYRRTQRFPLAFAIATSRAKSAPKEKRLSRLMEALAVANSGKLWPKSDLLLQASRAFGAEGKDRASFEYFAGRASFETGQFAKAIQHYQTAISSDPEAIESPESRYRLGKCFWIRRDKANAVKTWQELSALQDPFWSPLAQNELKLISN